jgi:hypothetical protein
VYLGPEGKLSEFIRAHKIGHVVQPEMLGYSNTQTLTDIINHPFEFNKHLDIHEFEIRNIAKKIISVINA